MPFTIAMDGPVGAGKSSVADAVARELGILHLDTGAMYRSVGLSALKHGLSLQDEAAVTALCAQLSMEVHYVNGTQQTIVDGEDVTGLIRTPEVSMAASAVGTMGGVRKCMVALQQKLAAQTSMLLDGRDIGTVVLPNASLKIYLTASPEERAMRRWKELQAKGAPDPYEQVLSDLIRRDDQDMNRPIDPLRPAEDAVTLDTTGMGFDAVVEAIVTMARERMTAL